MFVSKFSVCLEQWVNYLPLANSLGSFASEPLEQCAFLQNTCLVALNLAVTQYLLRLSYQLLSVYTFFWDTLYNFFMHASNHI